MTYKILQTRVSKGINWLNLNKKDWLNEVNLNKLDLGDSKICILGFAFDGYWNKVRDETDAITDKNKITRTQAVKMGFAMESGKASYYDLLTHVWFSNIMKLRNELN